MAQVVSFNGQRISFPDDMAPADIEAVLKKNAMTISGADPTKGMSTTEKVLAGVGQGMTSAVRALGGGSLLAKYGLPATKEEADQLDAPLKATTAGKVGSALGMGAVAAPVAFVPGANTYLGATGLGFLTGSALTEGDVGDRLEGGAWGAAGGAFGKAVGDTLGFGARKLMESRAASSTAKQVANAQKDAAVATAQNAGYVIPPADVKQSFANEVLNGFSGKIKTAQVASQKNQQVTNELARKSLGITNDSPLTTEALDQFRKQASAPYRDIAGMGEFNAAGSNLPSSVKVVSGRDPLLMGGTEKVDAKELVRAWKQSNHDATGYYRAYARDANPETLAKAQAAAASAKQIDDFLAKSLESAGKGESLSALKEARKQIAKSYTVEKALNSATGEVNAQVLAKELAKGKMLSGELRTIAEVAQAFPKATQLLKEAPKSVSPLDYAVGALTGASTGNPLMLGAMAARPAARSLILSQPYQSRMLANSYGPGLLDIVGLPALQSNAAKRLMIGTGIGQGLLVPAE